MSIVVRFRVDKDAATAEELSAYFEKRGSVGGFGTFEYGSVTEKEHYHYLLEGFESKKQVDAMRMDMKRKIPGLNRTNYSWTVADEVDRYARYCCKGPRKHVREPPVVVWRHSLEYTPEKISALHEAYWAENDAASAEFKEK